MRSQIATGHAQKHPYSRSGPLRHLTTMVAILFIGGLGLTAADETTTKALSRQKLLELVKNRVDTKLIVALVQKDCVDFDVDADALLELTKVLPRDVLEAAIQCRSHVPTASSKGEPAAAQIRLEISDGYSGGPFNHSNSCWMFLDYPGEMKALKAKDIENNHLAKQPEIHFYYSYGDPAVFTSDYTSVRAGAHMASVYCGTYWHRNQQTLDLEPGGRYTLLITQKNLLGGATSISGLRTDP